MDAGDRLLQQLQAFAREVARDLRQTGNMAPGMGEALDHPGFDGVARPHHDDGNAGGALLRLEGGRVCASHDEVDMARDQLIDHSRQSVQPSRGSESLKLDRLPGDVTPPGERIGETGRKNASAGSAGVQQPDSMDLILGLGESHELASAARAIKPNRRVNTVRLPALFIRRRHDRFAIDA